MNKKLDGIEVVSSGLDRNDKQLLAELVSSFVDSGSGMHEKDLPEGPQKDHVKAIRDSFTTAVAVLRSTFPNEAVRKLMSLVWDLCGSKLVPLALGPNVKTLSFGAMGPRGLIFTPDNWVEQIKEDQIGQLGAVVFVGSQAVDHYNGKMGSQEASHDVLRRAHAYEAEFLLTIQKVFPEYTFNDYQKSVLKDFPKGLSNIPQLVYTSKPFVAPS